MQKDYIKAKISVARTLMQIFAVAGILHIFYLAASYRGLNEVQILILNLAEKLDEF